MLLATLILVASTAASSSTSCFPEGFESELLARAEKDQSARQAFIQGGMKKGEEQAILAIDRDNTSWLRAIVRDCGWPKQSEVGEDAAKAAWLIAQHADMTPDFQIEVAKAMLRRVLEGEASGKRVALLVDRHARLQQIPQTYGMQYNVVDGVVRFLPVANPGQLDERRRMVGLKPFACYFDQVKEQNGGVAEWPKGVARTACESP